MKDKTILIDRLAEIEEIIEGTLKQQDNFTIKTTSGLGVTYTHDRETYLQVALDIALEHVQFLIEDVMENHEG
jgi:hypothetical protein